MKNYMFKCKSRLLVVILCLIVLCGMLVPVLPVMAADSEMEKIERTYEFLCRDVVYEPNSLYTDFWTEYTFRGYDIDFVTYVLEDVDSDNEPIYYIYFYILSNDPFVFGYQSKYLKTNGGIGLGSGGYNLHSNEITGFDHVFYSASFSGIAKSLDGIQGYPNVRYGVKDNFNIENVYSEFVTNGFIDWESNTMAAEYDESLPIINYLSYSVLTGSECHGDATFNSCFQLTWRSSDGLSSEDFLQIKVLCDYNYSTYRGTKRYYGSGFYDFSQIYGYIPVSNKSEVFCVTDFVDFLGIKDVNGFTILPQKIYLRVVRGSSYGNWVVYDVDRDFLNYPDIGVGDIIPGDTVFDDFGDYDSESKGTIDAPEKDSGFSFLGFDFSDLSSVLNSFVGIISSLISALGSFPTMFAAVFSFLPTPISNTFLLVFVLAIIIGVIKIFT